MTLVLFRTRRRDECSRLREVWGVAFEKAVRRKPLARRTRDLCKLNGASQGCRSSRGSSKPVEEEPAHLCKGESMAEVSLGGERKKMSGGKRGTLRRDALKRADSAVSGRVISCSRGPERWRTELELCRGESFDDGHRCAALGTAPQRVQGRRGRGFRFVFRWSGMKSGEAPWQQGGTPSVGEEAKVADANKAFGEQVQQETAQELIAREGHDFLLIVVGGVTPAEGDLAVGQCDQAMVGDGDAVGIAAEILQHVLGSTEGWFGVDDPVFAEERTQPGREELGMGEGCEFSGHVQLAVRRRQT